MAITIKHKIEDDEITPAMFGGQEHLEIAANQSFTQTIFQSLTEKEGTKEEIKILDLILNLSYDHGPASPSAQATLNAIEQGKTMGQAIGEGISQIDDSHGGAGGPLMEVLYKIKNNELRIEDYVKDNIEQGKRIPGLGHRVYKDIDPRAELIMNQAQELEMGSEFMDLVKMIKEEFFKQSGKNLPVNIDGAIAAAFCTLGLNPKAGIAVFIIARSLGLSAHYINNSEAKF